MKLTSDEERALSFIAALLLVSAAVRLSALPEPMAPPPGADFDLDAHIAVTERAVEEVERRNRPLGPGERIDPNTASSAELDRLPGVGPALAGRIVAARERERFRSVADMTRVPGVGERTAERLAPFLSLPTAVAAGVGGGRATSFSGRRFDVGDVGDGGDVGVGDLIDLNAADAAALVGLTGIGPVLAERIVAYRDSAGRFAAVDSLTAVKGIGPATLERIRARVRVGKP